MAAALAAVENVTPSVTWAQRPEIIFITINVADVKDPIIAVCRLLYQTFSIVHEELFDAVGS